MIDLIVKEKLVGIRVTGLQLLGKYDYGRLLKAEFWIDGDDGLRNFAFLMEKLFLAGAADDRKLFQHLVLKADKDA